MIGVLVLLAVMGFAAGAGASFQIRESEFPHGKSDVRLTIGVMLFWPVVLPSMLGALAVRRLAARAKRRAADSDRLADLLKSTPVIKDDETYRRLLIAVQTYERENGYDGR